MTVALEIWEITPDGLVHLLAQEPPGLAIGRVLLEDGSSVLGVLAEDYILACQPEISAYGGWRAYREATA